MDQGAKVDEGVGSWSRVCVSRRHVLGETGLNSDETRSAVRSPDPGQHGEDASRGVAKSDIRGRELGCPACGARRAFWFKVARRSEKSRGAIPRRDARTRSLHRRSPRRGTPAHRRPGGVRLSDEASRAGGGGGIRTHGSLTTSPDFKSGAFNHSTTPPWRARRREYASIVHGRQAGQRSPRGGRGDDEWRGVPSHPRVPGRCIRCRCCGRRRCCRRPHRSGPAA